MDPIILQPGKSQTVTLESRPLWNDTRIQLDAAATYDFSASGTWFDATISCGPEGYVAPPKLWLRPAFVLFRPFRRAPKENWFALIGALDSDLSTTFLIGKGLTSFRPARTGILTCFANDLPRQYGNNSGSVQLTITRNS